MKKIIIGCIFFFNIMPLWKNNTISILQTIGVHAQSQALSVNELANYLRATNPNHEYTVIGNQIRDVDLANNTWSTVNLGAASQQYQASINNGTYSPTNSTNVDITPDGDSNDPTTMQEMIAESEAWMEASMAEAEAARMQAYQDFLDPGNFGYEGGVTVCNDPDNVFVYAVGYSYSEALVDNSDSDVSDPNPLGNGLPCANRFLVGNKIIQFGTNQQTGITGINFDGNAMESVQYGTQKYKASPSLYDVVTVSESTEIKNHCTNEYSLTDKSTIKFSNERKILKFINFGKLDDPALTLPSGIERVTGKSMNTGQTITGYSGIPDNLANYSFTLASQNIITPVADVDQVVAISKTGVKYCYTLTQEDIDRGMREDRDKKYSLKDINLDHPINIPGWVRAFIEIFETGDLSPCTIDHVNDGLADLHNKQEYQNETDEDKKAKMEYKSMGYDLLFGFLYCQVDENAAKNESCGGQVAMAVMHELLAVVDVAQMKDGIVKIIQGLGNAVDQRVKNFTDGVKDVIENHTGTGNKDFKQIATEFAEKNISQTVSTIDNALNLAENFVKMYFTDCGNTMINGTSYDLCCYRRGELGAMILPIIITAGDYALVKLGGRVAAKLGTKAVRALELLNNARLGGKNILNELDAVMGTEKTVIKETNGTVISTIKREEEILDGATTPDVQVVITEAANVMDATTLSNLTTEVPNLRSISKGKIHKSAHKIDPQVDPVLQSKVDDIVANGDIGGSKTEFIEDRLFVDKGGYTSLDGKYGSNNGIDGLYIKGSVSNPSEIIVCEAKQWDGAGGVTLNDANPATGLPIQMSNNWIQYVADQLIATGVPAKVDIGNMLKDPANVSKIQKYLSVVNKSTGDINLLKLGSY